MSTLTLDYFALVSVCLLGAMSPGPSLFVILGIGSQQGVRAGVIAAWSHAFGVALWAGTSVLAWSFLLGNAQGEMGYVVHIVSCLASFYLIQMSMKLIKQVFYSKAEQSDESLNEENHSSKSYAENAALNHHSAVQASRSISRLSTAVRAGLSIALANPKLLVFFSAIYPQVLPRQYSSISLVLAVLIPLVIDGLWYHIVTIFAEQLGILKLVSKYQDLTQLMTAGILLFLASKTIYASIYAML